MKWWSPFSGQRELPDERRARHAEYLICKKRGHQVDPSSPDLGGIGRPCIHCGVYVLCWVENHEKEYEPSVPTLPDCDE